MSAPKHKRPVADDITRSVSDTGRVWLKDGFLAYAHRRIREISKVDEVPELDWPIPGTQASRDAYHERAAERDGRFWPAFYEVARVLNIRWAQLRQSGEREITDEQYDAFRAWEDASRRLEPIRSFVAVVRRLPAESREEIEDVWKRVAINDKVLLQEACNAFLLAADLADEMQRQLERATTLGLEVLARRHQDEPLIDMAPVAEFEKPRAEQPIVDAKRAKKAA